MTIERDQELARLLKDELLKTLKTECEKLEAEGYTPERVKRVAMFAIVAAKREFDTLQDRSPK